MSAIFGLLRHDSRSVQPEDLHRMAKAVTFRGPDGAGTFIDGPVGLGVARRHTGQTQEPVEPVQTPGGVVAAIVRIDNREDVVAELDWPGDTTDTELLGAVHRRWGDNGPSRLLGDFAYAIWSAERGTLTLVRDAVGVRPLYFARSPRVTAFGSDLHALLALPEVPDDVDELGVFNFFFPELLIDDVQTTCFAAVKRMPPARTLSITIDGHAYERVYWKLDPEREVALNSGADYAEAFREKFETAVRRRLRCSGPVGSTLSGGLDSSSIAAVAARQLATSGRPPLQTFAAVFPDNPEADESQFSNAVAGAIPAVHDRLHLGKQSPLAELDTALCGTLEPFYAPNFFISAGVCRKAASQGIRVLFDGTDGDSTVGHGLDFFPETAAGHDWVSFAREAEAVTRRFAHRTYATHENIIRTHAMPELQRLVQRGRLLATLKAVNVLGRQLGQSRAKLLRSSFTRDIGRKRGTADLSHLDPGFVERVDGLDRLRDLMNRQHQRPRHRRFSQWHALTAGAMPAGLEFFDRLGARFGVEYRYPFCDVELMEFCLAVPVHQQLHDGWSRWILRRAMSEYLPDTVCWRGGKADLSPVYHRGLGHFERERINRLSSAPGPSVTRFVRGEILREAGQRFLEQGTVPDRQLMWRAIVLDSWSSVVKLKI